MFENWVKREYAPRTAYSRISYAKRFSHCLFNMDLTELLNMNVEKRGHVLRALSCLSKFLGVHDEFLMLVKRYGLKWSVRNDDLLIKRFVKAADTDAVFKWICEVKRRFPDFAVFMDFMAVTGLRFSEAIESFNLIIRLSKEGRLNEYYNEANECLEHFRFKDVFLRRSKKAFVSFLPKEIVAKISVNKPLTYNAVQLRVKRCYGLRFGDIREAHATLLTKYLREMEIDFLHGRISTSVFMRNYFNPALIDDLKDRVFKAIAEIQTKL